VQDLSPVALSCLQWLVRIAWQASVLIAFVLVVQRVFRDRMSPAWRHALWLLVVARLALPSSLESRVSVFNWLRVSVAALASPAPRVAAPVVLTGPALEMISGNKLSAASSTETSSVKAKLVLADSDSANPSGKVRAWKKFGLWLALVWLLGVAVLIVRVVVESLRLQKMIAPKRLVTDSAVLELLEDCKQLVVVRAPVVLVQTESVSSPVLYGFLRPRLLLPAGLLQEFSRAELRFVFLHELAHVRRHDIALSWFMTLLQVLHWFNPLVWIAFARMKADRELACDAMVLSHTNENEHKAYGRTMLRLMEGFVPSSKFPSMAGILEDPSQLTRRICCIADFNGRSPSPAFALGAALVLALATLTDERAVASAQPTSTLSARFVTTRPAGDTDVRSITLRAPTAIDFEKSLTHGSLCLAAEADSTNLIKEGYKIVGFVEGLGADRWQRCANENAPSPRTAHSVVWTGRELIVWGGGARNFFKQSGARYDPATDTWRVVSTNNAPSGRWHPAAQWTGKEMIVWGGRADFYPTNHFADGALYNPETDTWRPMNSNGAPTARSQMVSVWTGKEFVVWAGRGTGSNSYDHPFNDGARYDPETDSWKPMAACPELGPRYDAAAIWTGAEMIVWGGGLRTGRDIQDQAPYLTYDTGARYDPVRDRWTLLPQEGAPHARYKHTAVWTGKEMLVWGGTTPNGANKSINLSFNDGARFDPATGHWKPISINGAPGERSSHMAVWSGTEMLVWGGGTSKGECLNTGGRYDPISDRWTPLAMDGAPAPRFMMRPDAGIWTGKQFLVCGGYDLNTEFGSAHAWSPPPVMQLFQR